MSVYHLFLSAVLVGLPYVAGANGILLTTAPEYPRDGEAVTVTASPVGDNPALVEFTWTVDGDEVASGYGVARIVTRAPALGESSLVEVVAQVGDTRIGSNTIDITPARVTLEWEANSLVPPSYSGRPLLGGQGLVQLAAIAELVSANGTRVRDGDIAYTWKVNGKVRTADSGYGKSTLVTEPPFFNSTFRVEVLATTRDGKLRASAGTTIRPVAPQVLIYETAPLTGLRSWRAITDSYQFSQDEVSFVAFPTYAGREVGNSIRWELNSEPVTLESADTRTTVFKKTGAGSGSYRVQAAFENPFKFLDFAEHSFLLQF